MSDKRGTSPSRPEARDVVPNSTPQARGRKTSQGTVRSIVEYADLYKEVSLEVSVALHGEKTPSKFPQGEIYRQYERKS